MVLHFQPRYILISFFCLLLTGCITPNPAGESGNSDTPLVSIENNPMVHAQGLEIVDGQGKAVRLRGVLLEGWLMWNGPLWGAGLTSETHITRRLEQMAGKQQTDLFRTAIYENFITEGDIRMIAEMGLNSVRVPFNHTVLEDDNPLESYTAPGWKYLDRLIEWCEKYHVYVVLDLHSVPGGQSGVFVCDPDPIKMWKSPDDQQRTIDLWVAIAKRYRNKEIVAGYDLINEPHPPGGADLVHLYRRIIKGIRSVDSLHMIILEGTGTVANDFSAFHIPLDANQVYSFHSYNFLSDATDENVLKRLAYFAEKQNVPLWNGEFGAHKSSWVSDEIALFENPKYHVNGWTFWPWKRAAEGDQTRYRLLMEIKMTSQWSKVAESIYALFGPDKGITHQDAKKGMDDFIQSMKPENLIFDPEMKKILSRQ